MRKIPLFLFTGILSLFLLPSCEKKDKDDKEETKVTLFQASDNITAKLDEFRSQLGPLNTTTGAVGGRREINWDGVPNDLVNKTLPNDFFNPVGENAPVARQRGISYRPIGRFQVSNSGFTDINAQAAAQFEPFSGDKTFANVSSNLWEVDFKVAGQLTEATIKGFGVVFSDVDTDNSTSLEFFNSEKSLGKYFVPKKSGNSNHSFLGVYFHDQTVTRVQVSHQGMLADQQNDISDGGTNDLVIMDDFIYSEPVKK